MTMSLHDVAHVCHEANRALQIVTGDPNPSPAWDQAPDWQKDSAIEGVVKAVGGDTPEQLHVSWCQFKRGDGWVYGPVKNPVAKTHPCLVPYAQLPDEQRVKDYVFAAIVRALSNNVANCPTCGAHAVTAYHVKHVSTTYDDGFGNEPPNINAVTEETK